MQITKISVKCQSEAFFVPIIILCFINFKNKTMSLRKNIMPSRKQDKNSQQKQTIDTLAQTKHQQTTPLKKQKSNDPPSINKTPQKLQPNTLKSTIQSKNMLTLIRENQLLKEAIKIRDYEITSLKQSVKTYKKKVTTMNTKLTTESQCNFGQQYFSFNRQGEENKTVLELTSQLNQAKNKNTKSCELISELQTKLRQALSKIELNEQQFNQEKQVLKSDTKYQSQEYERILDNIKIQNEQKVLKRLQIVEQRYKQEKNLLQEQIMQLKGDIFQKTQEIFRINQKLKKQKQNYDGNYKIVEIQNGELRKAVYALQKKHIIQLKEREESLISMFNQDLDSLKQSQKHEIQLLCKRIHSLKVQLQDKDTQVKDLWKARQLQAQKLFSAQNKSQSNEKSILQQRKISKSKQKVQFGTLQAADLSCPALQQYMN